MLSFTATLVTSCDLHFTDFPISSTSVTTPITSASSSTSPAVNPPTPTSVTLPQLTTAATVVTTTTAATITTAATTTQPSAPVVSSKRSSSSSSKRQVLANTDSQELIVFCIDISSEMNKRRYKARAGASFSGITFLISQYF